MENHQRRWLLLLRGLDICNMRVARLLCAFGSIIIARAVKNTLGEQEFNNSLITPACWNL
jgi:hypothetical protein